VNNGESITLCSCSDGEVQPASSSMRSPPSWLCCGRRHFLIPAISTNLLWYLTPSSFLLAQLHRRDGAMHLLPSLSSVMHCRPVPRALHAKPRICKASLLARCSFPCGLWDVIALTIEMEAKQPCRCREPHSCMPRFIVPKPRVTPSAI